MFAIIATGGKQYKVQPGDVLKVEKLHANPGEAVEVNEVLAVSKDGGLKVGSPLVEGAKVVLKVEEHGRGDKIIIFKYKPKKNYRRKQGHRQSFTKVRVEEIKA